MEVREHRVRLRHVYGLHGHEVEAEDLGACGAPIRVWVADFREFCMFGAGMQPRFSGLGLVNELLRSSARVSTGIEQLRVKDIVSREI